MLVCADDILQQAGGGHKCAANMNLFQMESEKCGLHFFVQSYDPGSIIQKQHTGFREPQVLAQAVKGERTL